MNDTHIQTQQLTRSDFVSDQAVKWCPGCGDYAILAQTQKVFPDLGVKKENFVFVSGIGCSSRFPYYMETYGFHTIHGRAAAIASGVKLANPDLSVWIVTGDGDGLSIGGNHTIHIMRRNIDVNIILFNNRIYGLTKGQYSPTSELGKVTKSTPLGSIDRPFNPPALALGSHGSFIARTLDRDTKHMQEMIKRSHAHHGTSFLEVYQNCVIFNDGAFERYTAKDAKLDHILELDNGKPMLFGSEKNLGIHLDGNTPRVIDITLDKWSVDDVLVHDEQDEVKASILSHFTYQDAFPTPIGVLYAVDAPVYEDLHQTQIDTAKEKNKGSVTDILNSGDTWTVD